MWNNVKGFEMGGSVKNRIKQSGVTILCYLPRGNALTLESVAYGLAAGGMLASALLWLRCFQAVITSDKVMYLFGRAVPALSLILSMAMGFIPRFRQQLAAVNQAQQGIGRGGPEQSRLQRMRVRVNAISILVSWALENAVDTADSMKSRGYGLPGRTAFSIYRMEPRDRGMLAWLLWCGFYITCGALAGGMDFQYFPMLRSAKVTPLSISFFMVYLALCLTPVILAGYSAWRWQAQGGRTEH